MVKMNYVVTIIVPVFNMELYIHKCLESIIGQSYNNTQIILVNDGSSDSSPNIIDEFASKDRRIVAIHKENGGIGSALKAAFDLITGDYVLFVDSDDWLELDAVENLVKLALDNEADLVSFGIRAYNPKGEEVSLPSFKNIDLINTTNEAILKTHFEVLKHPTLVRLYKSDVFQNIVIFEQNIGIDEMLTPQLLTKCTRAIYTSKVYYNVYLRQNSVSRNIYNDKKINETIKVYQFLLDFAEKKIPNYFDVLRLKYLFVLYNMYSNYLSGQFSLEKNNSLILKNEFKSSYSIFSDSQIKTYLSLSNRFQIYLLRISPGLFKSLQKVKSLVK
jgi:glycosyltransferase involved in cell wall biosynthesis